jgi:molybdate transport system substrate-binding protein
MSTPARSRPTRTRSLGAILLALVLLAVGCSDAPTEEEIERADDGIDPSIVSVFVSEPMLEVVQELGDVFLIQHRGTTFQYIAKPSEDLAGRVAGGFRPAMWIDRPEILAPFVSDEDTVGPPAPVGEDVMQFIVIEDYKGPTLTLDVFGAGANDATSGLCEPAAPCGVAARAILDQAGVVPEPDALKVNGVAIVAAIRLGEIQTSLVYRSEASRLFGLFAFVELPEPTIGMLTYQSISMVDLPVATEFQNWIATSPEATEILIKRGYRSRDLGPTP